MTPAGPRIAAVIVTHNGERYLEELLASVSGQTRRPDHVVFVDDQSRDATLKIIGDWRQRQDFSSSTVLATSRDSDVRTRIAGNFALGMREASSFELIALSDQDDIWQFDRVERQACLLESEESALLLAGNASLIDADGVDTSRTISNDFEWPDWSSLDSVMRWRTVLSRPLVQGGACMLRSAILDRALPIPRTWLHDRWLSLVAAASGGLVLNSTPVLQYRIHADQSLGARELEDGGRTRLHQAMQRGTSLGDVLRRTRSIRNRINPILRSSGVDRAVTYSDLLEMALTRQN